MQCRQDSVWKCEERDRAAVSQALCSRDAFYNKMAVWCRITEHSAGVAFITPRPRGGGMTRHLSVCEKPRLDVIYRCPLFIVIGIGSQLY